MDTQYGGSNDKSKRKRIQNNLVKARMMREERMCTDTFINILIPLSFLGMMSNFIPYLMIFVPIQEQDLCWFFFLTRSPFVLKRIPYWLASSTEVMKYTINGIEMVIQIWVSTKISSLKL